MKKTSQQRKLSIADTVMVAGGMFLVLICVRAGSAQQVGKTPPPATQTTASSEQARLLAIAHAGAPMPGAGAGQSASAPQMDEGQEAEAPKKNGGEGIKVHGHWVITVKNADGSVAEHRDFENSLLTSGGRNYGSQLLAALLSGNASPGGPGLALIQTPVSGGDQTNACFISPNNCTIFTVPGSLFITNAYFPVVLESGLTATANFAPTASLVLGGTFEQAAAATSTYTAVESFFPVCVGVDAAYVSTAGPFSYLFSNTSTFGLGNYGPNQCNSAIYSTTGYGVTAQNILFVPVTYTLITQGGVAAPLTLAPSQTIAINFTLTFS